jgi:O-antigen ligase
MDIADIPEQMSTSGTKLAGTEITFWAFYIFFTCYFIRPEDWIPGLTLITPQSLAAIISLAGAAFLWLNNPKLPHRIERYLLLALVFWYIIVIPTSNWPGGSFRIMKDNVLRIVLMCSVLLLVVDSLPRLRRLLAAQCLAVTFLAFMSIGNIDPVTGRLFGRSKAFGNANDLAVVSSLSIPLCIYLAVNSKRILRLIWIGCVGLLLYVNVLTYSRTGFLATLVAFMLLLWHYGVKTRRYTLVLVVIVAASSVFPLAMPDRYSNRLVSIFDGARDESGSRAARAEVAERALQVNLKSPLFGVGPGQFAEISGSWHVAHNTFLEFSSEAGFPALLIFVALIARSVRSLKELHSFVPLDPGASSLAGCLGASVGAFCTGAMFTNFGYTFFPYFLLCFCTVARHVYGQRSLRSNSVLVSKI